MRNFRKIDYQLILIALILFTIGIFSISIQGISFYRDTLVIRQLFWLIISCFGYIFIYYLGYHTLIVLSPILYLIILGLLIFVLIAGPIRSGAQRWLNILGLNFQPAEFAKLAIIFLLARYHLLHKDDLRRTKVFIITFALLVPYIIFIFLQPDLGSAFIFIPIFITISFIGNIRKRDLIILFLLFIFSSPLLWQVLKDYQKQRILVFINPNLDPLGAGYTIIQSKIAIGAGRLLGKSLFGWKNQFGFLPESHTDFIFANISEKWGFLGASIVILLYYLLLKRILRIGVLTNNFGGKIVSVGIATMIFAHVFINIGMCLGILPVVGIPLPFISYGGSNLLANTVGLAVVNSIRRDI